MDSHTKSVKKWYRKKKLWAVVAVVFGAAVWAVFFRGGKTPTYEIAVTRKSDLVQEVSVTGKVKSAQAVDLQFEATGRIALINYKAGDKVSSGAVIASLENQDSQAQVLEKEAVLESAQADLDQTIKNFNSLNDSTISTALKTDLKNAEENLANVQKKADNDLVLSYGSGFNVLNEAMVQADTSFSVFKSLRETYFNSPASNQDSRDVGDAEDKAKTELYGLSLYNRLGAKDYVAKANTDKSNENIDIALDKLEAALVELKNAFSVLQTIIQDNLSKVSVSDRNTANSEAASVASRLSAVSNAIRDISSQKITNDRNISDAKSRFLSTKAAFPSQEDIIKKQAAVKQAEAALLSFRSQLQKFLIVAPFTGIIGKIDAERGQTVNSSTIIVSLISSNDYQIEANITEVDIGKIKPDNPAVLTLDAYGSQVYFNAKVSSIDAAATVVEGVTTYRTIFDFDGEPDSGIRPNMTANIDIQTAVKEDVIIVPQRAVISRNGNKIVRIYRGDNALPEERIIQLGISGKDGFIEIVSGLGEGENVITFINE